jgi:hypothetical protein
MVLLGVFDLVGFSHLHQAKWFIFVFVVRHPFKSFPFFNLMKFYINKYLFIYLSFDL